VTVTGTGAGNLVTADQVDIQVNQANLSGTVVSFTVPTASGNGAITISGSGTTSSFAVAPTARVTWNGLSLTFADLSVGDGVKLALTNGIVSGIELTSHPSTTVNLTGKVSALDAQANTFTLTVQTTDANGQAVSQTYTVGYSGQTSFTYLGLSVSESSLANNQTVTVTGGQVGQAVSATLVDIQQVN